MTIPTRKKQQSDKNVFEMDPAETHGGGGGGRAGAEEDLRGGIQEWPRKGGGRVR